MATRLTPVGCFRATLRFGAFGTADAPLSPPDAKTGVLPHDFQGPLRSDRLFRRLRLCADAALSLDSHSPRSGFFLRSGRMVATVQPENVKDARPSARGFSPPRCGLRNHLQIPRSCTTTGETAIGNGVRHGITATLSTLSPVGVSAGRRRIRFADRRPTSPSGSESA